MGSQFVDLNGDGRDDLVTATYDGSPHVAFGVEGGFAAPEHLLDRDGERIALEQFWDADQKRWHGIDGNRSAHCITAVAFDWDGDGDLDLLLGDKNQGNVFLQRNEGRAGEPAFTGVNEPVLAGGAPFALEGGVTALRLCDWDGDGLTDLVCGSFGEPYRGDPPGGVWLYRNVGSAGAPEFARAVALLAPTRTTGTAADRANVGLYADPVDYDGDGDLDLLVGGYSIWTPAAPVLDAAMQERLAAVRAAIAATDTEMQAALAAATDGATDDEDRLARVRAHLTSDARQQLTKRRADLTAELEELAPGPQREAGIWIHLQKG